jgi:CPA1 family monovalent cation:H+ antiporter
VTELELLIGLLGVVAGTAWLARAVGLPYPIALVAAGLVIGLTPGLPMLVVDPDVILLVFLPPLIHAAAWTTSPRRLRAEARTVGLLAVVLVGVTMACVAAVAHAVVPALGWPAAFVLGAVVAPTDTVAATAIFRRLGVPERIVALVEGESLLNDGTALVLYRIAVGAAATGGFQLAEAAGDLLLVGTGGALLGLAVAAGVRWVRVRIDDATIEITVTLLTPYLAFIPAEELGLSGVLAAVSSGLYLGWRSAEDFAPSTRLQAYSFWTVFTFVLESLLFILIGLQAPAVLGALEDQPLGGLLLAAAAVSGTVIAVRLLFVLGAGALESRWDARRERRSFNSRERSVVGWSGMRGAVSLAAALAIPLETTAGAPFPGRELVLFLALAVIGVTLSLQGLTLPALVSRLGVQETRSSARGKAVARFRTVEAALERVTDLSFDAEVPSAALERAREMYALRAQQLAGECSTGVPEGRESDVAAWTRLRRHLLAVERAALLDLRREGRVGMGVMREVERDLDLEEERLNRASPVPESTRPPAARARSGPDA